MTIRSLILAGALAGVVITSAAPSRADPSANTQTTPSAAATTSGQSPAVGAPVADPVVCKHVDAPTGSRLGAGRACRKKSEWAELERRARAMIDGIQHAGGMGNCNTATAGGSGVC